MMLANEAALAQVAALPVRFADDGACEVMLITSRETQRWIIPKGWPMAGLKDSQAAAREAREEAGLVGRVGKRPIGSYSYWKRCPHHFAFCTVQVYVLEVERRLKNWKEKGQRRAEWFAPDAAAELVEEPGLKAILHDLRRHLSR
jgi:8-oxo-dGTP pyrophosphatase MutT (NUDIX family)